MSSINNNGESFCFDKTNFCRENGLAVTQKKDGKSHSIKAQELVFKRQEKTADQIKLLPNSMQKKLQELELDLEPSKFAVKTADKDKGKEKKGKGLGQCAMTTLLSEQYDEELLAENDLQDELFISQQIVLEEEKEKIYWDNVALWQKYGLTKEQYDDTIEYNKNCEIFNQYLDELNEESGEDPVFIQELEAKIKAFQDAYETKQETSAKADDENDWWIDESLKEDKYEKPYVFENDENDEWIDQSLEECGKPDYDEEEWKADCADHMIEYYRTSLIAYNRSI